MTALEERIAQFEHMCAADPENDMAHFSLGSAYLQAERYAEAAKSFQECLEFNPEMSKAYQLAGEAMIKAGWEDQAVTTLNRGYEVAAGKGDMMPKNAMAELLKSIGREPPQLSQETQAAAKQVEESGAFICQSTGRAGAQLTSPPFRGPVGEWIKDHISRETWQAWIGQGTKVINELRLDLSREEDQATYDRHMYDFLGIDDRVMEEIMQSA